MSDRHFYARYGKRWFDVVVSAAGLVVLGIPLAAIGLLIVLIDGPPVLFRQQRIGLHGKVFTVYKFRSMMNRQTKSSTITVAGDVRITQLGKWLRRSKLDELPQLFNVMKGEMSFVGPRPDVPGYMDKLNGTARAILGLRPGITGPATLAFRNEEVLLAQAADPQTYNDQIIFPEKVRLNLEYLRNLSLLNDLRCILQTVLPAHDTAEELSHSLSGSIKAHVNKPPGE
jgi:lipopolysaccharide/colanic/teichoic acid biosynthesis glycosyltransferase